MSNKRRRRMMEQLGMPSKGIYDQLPRDPEDQFDEEVDEEALTGHGPIDPSPQMAVQLSVAEPPVEDEDFVPGSIEELSWSASALSKAVPSDQIEWYYKQLHKLVDKATDRDMPKSEEIEIEDVNVDGVEVKEVKEESIKRTIKKALYEILESEDEREFDSYRSGGIDYFAEEEVEEEVVPAPDDSISLEDLAAEFGYSGAPGMRQEIQRITDKMEYFSNAIKKEDLEALLSFAIGEYVDTLETSGILDDEDIQDLQAAPGAVRDLDSFRFFFVGAFILPAYKEVSREARKKVIAGIKELGLPKELDQTVLNQVSGGSARKRSVIQNKLMKLAKAGKILPEEVPQIISRINNAMPALKQAGELSDDLVERSLEKWQSLSTKKRESLLNQAMKNTAEV